MRKSAGAADRCEALAEFVGEGVGDGDGVRAGLDHDGAVTAGGRDEFAGGPAGLACRSLLAVPASATTITFGSW